MKIRIIYLLLVATLFSCNDQIAPVIELTNDLESSNSGVFILNEGNFNNSNGSLSFLKIDSLEISNNIFYFTNGRPLGDVVQSMIIKDSIGFIVVNNSNKIEVININTYNQIATITGFESPRYIQVISNKKAYVSNLYGNYITIISLENYEITGRITTGCSTENMVKINKKVYVTNWSYGNKILIINTQTDELTNSLIVTKEPNSLVVDKNSKLWVLSSGGFLNEKFPALTRINTNIDSIELIIYFPDINSSPSHLTINSTGDTIFYINRDIFKMRINDNSLPTSPLITANGRLFYSISAIPDTSLLLVSDAIDYNQNGIVFIYNFYGEEQSNFYAGIIPSNFCYK